MLLYWLLNKISDVERLIKMKNKDKTFIWSDGWWIEGNDAWFVGGMSNILFCLNLNTNECKTAVHIPDTKPNVFRLNPNCVKYDSYIICFPGLGECIWIYNLENQKFSYININNPDKVQLLFEIQKYGDKIFAVSEGWNKVIEVDVKQKEIEYYVVSERDCFAKSIFVNNVVYSLSAVENKVYQFNLDTKKVEEIIIPKADEELYTICFDGEKFWLSGYKKKIYVWNKETDTLTIIDKFPDDFGIYNFTGDADIVLDCEKEEYGVPLCPTFLYSIMVGEYVWFIPYTTNKIIYINKKNYKLYSFEIEDENETRDTLLANLLHHKYLLEYVKDNRFIGLYSLKNNRILEIDAKELNYKWKDYTFSDKSLTQCCEINNNKLCREGDSLERLVYCKKIKRIHDDASNVIMKNSGKIIYDKIMIDLSDS